VDGGLMSAHQKSWRCAVLVFLCSKFAFAQGCALCYTQAASASGRFIHALRGGIFVLVFPPLFISLGIAWAAYRKRNQFQRTASEENAASNSLPQLKKS
jgi:hypothetical protein